MTFSGPISRIYKASCTNLSVHFHIEKDLKGSGEAKYPDISLKFGLYKHIDRTGS